MQRLDRHGGAQVRAADTDVDHQREGLAGTRLDASLADRRGEIEHALALGAHQCVDVHAVDHQRRLAGRATQRRVQHGPAFGDVDGIAAEHRRDALAQPQLLGKCGELPDELGRDPLA